MAMAYISSIGIIHRDLAARNILLSKLLHVKLADFSKAVKMTTAAGYQDDFLDNGQEKKFPLKWIAPEVMEVCNVLLLHLIVMRIIRVF